MDQDHAVLTPRGIPRLSSRLPRATTNNIPEIHQDDTSRVSTLPRSSGPGSLRFKPANPLTENTNTTLRSRFGFNQQSLLVRNKSPVRSTQDRTSSANLETTPPSNIDHGDLLINGDENGATNHVAKQNITTPDAGMQKRKPRPSLTERTLETLAQIPPSPSPSRRRSDIVGLSESMGPPARPASSMRNPRSTARSAGRSLSPQKSPFRPAGRSDSPSKDVPPLPAAPSFTSIYTPPRALVKDKGSRIAKPSSARRSISTAINDNNLQQFRPKQVPHSHKVKSMYDLRAAAAKSSTAKPALNTIFTDPPKIAAVETKSNSSGSDRSSGLLKPRSPGENVLAPSPKQISKRKPAHINSADTTNEGVFGPDSNNSKSSAALRETIAKAKAAKRKVTGKLPSNGTEQLIAVPHVQNNDDILPLSGMSLKRRLQNAISTGVLNLAAFGLTSVPPELLQMYDYNEDSNIAWSETVDLTKLVMADNQLDQLPDVFFPDWSDEELAGDDEKSNIFRGLEVLDLRGNNLTRLPLGLRRLDQLHTLVLSNNRLTNDAFDILSQIPNLANLQLSNNRFVGSVPDAISRLKHLHSLSLRDNQFSAVSSTIEDLPMLRTLDLAGNILTTFSFHHLVSLPLVDLNVAKNKLAGILCDASLPQGLMTLNASNNQLTRICDGEFVAPKLQTLILDFNHLELLPDLSKSVELVTITASENRLSDLPTGFAQLSALTNANLSGNNIKSVDINIARMEQLRTINLTGNPLREKKLLTLNTDDLKTNLAKRLGTEEVDGQDLFAEAQNAFSGGQQTSHIMPPATASEFLYTPVSGILNLSSLSLSSIEPSLIDLSGPINTVRLSNNDLTTFPHALLSHPSIKYSLTSLDMSHNQSLHSTEYLNSALSLPVLKSLNIVSTGLTSLDQLTEFLSAPELRELNISCHRLTGHVPWVKAYFPSLRTLLATDNWFTSIDIEAVRGLEVLDIRNNEIESLPPKIGELGNHGDKRQEGRLRVLEVSGNKFRVPRLTVVEKGTEAILKDLRRMVPTESVGDEWRD